MGKTLSAGQWIGAILAAPPVIFVCLDIGPGHWANAAQDAVIAGHSISLSVLAVIAMEFALIAVVAIATRWLTGQTLVQLFTKRKLEDREANQPD